MGLLDDAIREHLELKKRRGADAEEVSRLEQEALGPPQRGEFAGASAPAEPAEPAEPVEPVGPVEPDGPPAERDEAPPEAETAWLEDEPEPLDEPRPEPPAADDPTVAYAAPAATPPTEPAPEGDDVLEETPDFLQETPEHDRLWFEQKPPRDFDLDR
jgi:hypothetical protein